MQFFIKKCLLPVDIGLDLPLMTTQQPALAPNQFVRVLRKALAGSGHSLREAARKSGISPAYLSLLVKGERGVPAPNIVTKLEQVLDIPNGKLFDAAGLADSTTKTFLRKEQARPFMRSLAPLTDEELNQLLQVTERFAKKHHPDAK
jgi:transcriptional regulator with XRE-family HTH domain